MSQSLKLKELFSLKGILLYTIVALIYFYTLAPGVLQIDSGELAAVQYNFGISHPTGYPLFTVVGFLWSKLNPGFSPIYWLNVLALLFSLKAVYYFFLTSKKLFDYLDLKSPFLENGLLGLSVVEVSAIVGTLFLAFSRTFWLQSTGVEVYSMQMALFAFIMYCAVNVTFNYSSLNAIYLAVSVALGFSNHLTTLLVLPGLVYLHFQHHGFNKKSIQLFVVPSAIGGFILVFMYGILILRASYNPILNWGDISNLENFWRHITGWQYRTWMFSADAAEKNLKFFFQGLPYQFTWLGLAMFPTGLYYIFQKNKTIFYYLTINLIFATMYVVYYDINDLDSYFIFTYMNMGIGIGASVLLMFDRLDFLKKHIQSSAFILIIVVFPIFKNIEAVSQRDVYVYDDYTLEALNSLEQNAILISFQWDVLVAPSLYYQFVEDVRRDVLIIDKELLRRSWYYKQLAIWQSEPLQKVEKESNAFLEALQPFERNEKIDPVLLQATFTRLITNLIVKNFPDRPIYLAPEIIDNDFGNGRDVQLPSGFMVVPQAYFYRVYNQKGYQALETFPKEDIRYPERVNYYVRMIKSFRTRMLIARARYELENGKIDEKVKILGHISNNFPDYNIPADLY